MQHLWHVTISVRGRRALARDEAERRAFVRTLLRVAGASLLFFCFADDHVHLVLRSPRAGRVAAAARRAFCALRPDLTFKPPHLEAVDTRAYLQSLVPYVFTQTEHHGLPEPSALWSGSSFQELVGARLPSGGFDPARLLQELPRLRVGEVFEKVGLERVPLVPADDEALARVGAARIAELAAAVFCVGPDLAVPDRSPPFVAARALAVRVALDVGLPPRAIARQLGRGVGVVYYLARQRVEPAAVLALRRRFTLEERVARLPRAARGRSPSGGAA